MTIVLPEPPRFNDQGQPVAEPGQGCARAVKTGAVIVLILIGAGVVGFFGWMTASKGLAPLGSLTPPVFVPTEDGGHIVLLTGQWQTIFNTGRGVGVRNTRTVMFIDLWAFNAADATPLWRRRLENKADASVSRSVLGVQGDTIWLLMNGKLVTASLKNGDITAAVGRIETVNPKLRAMLPAEYRYYAFDSHGLRVTAADGRVWTFDPATFVARLAGETPEGTGRAYPPTFFTPFTTGMFQERGLAIPGAWLGLLSDAEAKQFEEYNTIGGMDRETRRKLWRAKVTPPVDNFTRERYTDFAPLPAGLDFLDGGLLRNYRSGENLPALWFREPDSVLVLHRERLGETGKLHLTRVAGPEGTVVWDAALPISMLQSVMPGKNTLVLFGEEIFPPEDGERASASDHRDQRLVAIAVPTGAVSVFDFAAVDAHPEAVPVEAGL